MHISQLHDYCPEPSKVVDDFLSQGRKGKIKNAIEELIEDEYAALEEYANERISQVAAWRAEKFLEKVLAGDSDASMALLGDRTNAQRYRQLGYDAGKPWAHLIHGTLFETDSIVMRRKIVEANAELLRNERIADLESIVDGLTQQVRELEKELNRR